MDAKEDIYRDQLLTKMKNFGVPLYAEVPVPFSQEEREERQRKAEYLTQKLAPGNTESLHYDAAVAGQDLLDYEARLHLELDELNKSLEQGATFRRVPSQKSVDFLLDECVNQKIRFDRELAEKDQQNTQIAAHSAHLRVIIWALSFVVFFLALGLILNVTLQSESTNTVSASIPATSRPAHPTLSSAPAKDDSLPLPYNGAVFYREHDRRTYDSYVAPLEIKAEGEDCNFYIKMVTASGKSILEFFVRAGETAEVNMPTGTFYLRYACGSKWYGQDQYFGEDTAYFSSKDAFHFTESDDGYNGYTVSLHKVPGGNLSTEPIDPEDF